MDREIQRGSIKGIGGIEEVRGGGIELNAHTKDNSQDGGREQEGLHGQGAEELLALIKDKSRQAYIRSRQEFRVFNTSKCFGLFFLLLLNLVDHVHIR